MTYDAIIRNATLLSSAVYGFDMGDLYIIGDIYGDTEERVADGGRIKTSSIRGFNMEAGLVRTKDSIYKIEGEMLIA